MSPSPERFAAVVPIRSWTTGKSRLGVADGDRATLARAFALDVLDVLHASAEVVLVVVVTSDADVRATVAGSEVVDDRGRGINDAVARGAAHALARGPSGVLVVPSDLPCLTTAAVSEVVRLSEGHAHAFCADADGDGTTVVVSRDPAGLVTSYGPRSAAKHRAAGLAPLEDAPAAARRDVDTVAHLREAVDLGVGRRTAGVTDALSTGSIVTARRRR